MKLYAVGDIFLKTKDNRNPFENVNKLWEDKDILFGNLEVVLSDKGKAKQKSVIINTDPKNVKYLKNEGFDVLNIANNHIMDFGEAGFCETIENLKKNDLKYIGAAKTQDSARTILNVKDTNFGFLGYHIGGIFDSTEKIVINTLQEEKILSDILKLKNKCDYIIVSLHWGIENVYLPSPDQIKLARKLIDSGASIVLGHGPHVVQGIEKYNEGIIAYSLGNFNFVNSMTTKAKTNLSIILSIELSNSQIEYNTIPVIIDNNFKPTSLSSHIENEFSDSIKKLSEMIENNNINENYFFENIATEYLSSNLKSFIKRIKKYGIKHLLQCLLWLVSPFNIKCYFGIIRKKFKKIGN